LSRFKQNQVVSAIILRVCACFHFIAIPGKERRR